MDAINLNAGVTVKQIYSDLDEAKIKEIETVAVDGFTEDELQKLENDGIDISKIKDNAAVKGEKVSVDDKAKEIREKYCKDLVVPSDDAYSTNNPELTAFSTALDDGLMRELSDAGFSKTEIVDIISQAFPSIGIKNNKQTGKYDVPNGHGSDANAIYNKFVEKLTQATSVDPTELLEAQRKLLTISTQITENNRSLKSLEYKITMLQDEIERKINDAIDESKDIVEDQKEQSKSVVSKRLAEYTSANGEMTYDEFMEKVGSDLDGIAGTANSKLSSAVMKIVAAQREMVTLRGYLTKMDGFIKSNASLTDQAKEVQAQIQELETLRDATEGCATDEDCNRCDPIGFSDAQGVRYDFFIDKDNDGNVTNENEFLGAENGFQEMIDNDANADKKVTGKELDEKNVKVVVTKADGTQEIKSASEVLGEDGSIDLTSYRSQNTELSNGNALLGTFSVTKDGETLNTGYQTLDTLGWLDANFEFSDEINGVGRHVRAEDDLAEALDYSEKYNIFEQKYEDLENKLNTAAAQVGLDASEIKSGIESTAEKEAANKAEVISNIFEMTQAKEAEEAEKAEETKEAEEAKEAQEIDEEKKDKELEEEI